MPTKPDSAALDAGSVAEFVSSELRKRADPSKAGPMAAYLKTEMPFYGVDTKGRSQIERELKKRLQINSRRDYEVAVASLWGLPHREEKYLALRVARQFKRYVDATSVPIYMQMIRDASWWDLVDEISIHLVGKALLRDRDTIAPIMDQWIEHEHMWLRRCALISQNSHKKDTDHQRLFSYCERRAHETEFFIRKAIGWALRDFSYAEPDLVISFLKKRERHLSGLSFREATKGLKRLGHWK